MKFLQKETQAQLTHKKVWTCKITDGASLSRKKGLMPRRFQSNRIFWYIGKINKSSWKNYIELEKTEVATKKPKHVKQKSQNNQQVSRKLKSQDKLKKATLIHCIENANGQKGKKGKKRAQKQRAERDWMESSPKSSTLRAKTGWRAELN